MPPTYYRGCWHVVSRDFLEEYRQPWSISYPWCSSSTTELYNPKAFITHAALLGQTFVHCRKFLTAASRRSLGRVSVPMWPFILSDRLCIIALVGRYLTNKLIQRKPIPQRCKRTFNNLKMPRDYLCGINSRFQLLSPALGQVAYVLLTRSPLNQSDSKLSDLIRSTCMY